MISNRTSNQHRVKISFRVILLYICLQGCITQSKQTNTHNTLDDDNHAKQRGKHGNRNDITVYKMGVV